MALTYACGSTTFAALWGGGGCCGYRRDKIKNTGGTCSLGTVCCPQIEGTGRSVPLDGDTLRLLRVLAHGHIQHAPRLSDPIMYSGWKGHVPISPNGVGQCVDPFTIQQAFRDENKHGKEKGSVVENATVLNEESDGGAASIEQGGAWPSSSPTNNDDFQNDYLSPLLWIAQGSYLCFCV